MKEVINDGQTVYCDLCNADGDAVDNKGEPLLKGGGLFGSNAICPDCASGLKLDEAWDKSKSFGQNCREYRVRTYGNPDNVIIISDWEDYFNG